MSIEASRLRIYHFLLQVPNRWEVARQAHLGGERTIAGIIRRRGHGQTRILEKIEAVIPEGWEPEHQKVSYLAVHGILRE